MLAIPKTMRSITLLAAAFGACLSALSPATAQSPPIALTGATIYPVSSSVMRNATMVIADGKITAVGAHVSPPANARVIDLHGAAVIPGLVDASSSLFLSAQDLSGAGTADLNVLDAADLYRDDAAKALARGVTTLYLSPGTRGSVAGTGAIVKLHTPEAGAGDVWAKVVRREAALHLAIGISTNGRSTSLERLNSYETLRTLFRSAQQYTKSFENYDRDLKAYEKQQSAPKPAPGATAPAAIAKPSKPRRVPAQETVAAALSGTLPVRIEAHRQDDILNALRLIDEFHLKAMLESPTESRGLEGEMARRGVAVVWGTPPTGAPTLETRSYRAESAAALVKSGVALAITPGSRTGTASRFLLENAALAVSFGLTPEHALRAVTLDAAKAVGLSDRVGSLQVGKDADLVILSSPPLKPGSKVQRVFVDGQEQALRRTVVSRAAGGRREAGRKGGAAGG
jgi:imidazolonepropionase-like amidohydrolase